MKVERLARSRSAWALVVALASALAACADEDRPPTSESAPISSVALGGSADVSASDGDAGASGSDPEPCEPRSHRDCKMTYRDDSGELHCPTSLQYCSVDGTAWLACGAYTLDDNGDPQPVH